MSSCESYIVHRWELDLNEEDLLILRRMVELAMKHAQVNGGEYSNADYAGFLRVHKLVECVE